MITHKRTIEIERARKKEKDWSRENSHQLENKIVRYIPHTYPYGFVNTPIRLQIPCMTNDELNPIQNILLLMGEGLHSDKREGRV